MCKLSILLFFKKEEVVLLQYDYQEDQEDVLYGGGFQDRRNRYNNRGQQQQQEGGYQKPMGYHGNFQQNQGNFQNFQQNLGNFQRQQNQGQRNFQNFQKNPNKPVGAGIVSAIHKLSQKEQMEIVGTIARTFMKPPIMIPQGSTQNNINPRPTKIFQVDPDKEEEVFMSADLDRIFLSGTQDHTSVIIDTGSAYNLIGKHLIPILRQRLAEAGRELRITPTKKKFQFGGHAVTSSSGKILVPLVLGNTVI